MHTLQYLHELWSVLWLRLLLKKNFTNLRHRPMPVPPTPILFFRFTSVSTQVGQFSFRDCDFSVSTFVHPVGNCTQSLFIALRRFWSLCYHILALKKVSCKFQILFDAIESRKIGRPLFKMCWFYSMGIAKIALDPPPPSVKRANMEKVPQTILASPYTPRQRGKKVSQTIQTSLYPPPPPLALTCNATMETTHFKKGFPLQEW